MIFPILFFSACATTQVDAQIESRVEAALKTLTLEQKCSLLHGSNGDMKYARSIPRLFDIEMNDGPNGVRGPVSTAWPSGVAMAATWDRDLVNQVGAAIGRETLAAGHRVILGPAVNLMRTPLGGRTFEYMGEDPWLAGKLAGAYIRGVQSTGAGACLKHYTFNEQEKWRTTIDVRASDRAFEELYGQVFRIAVQDGKPWSIMTAYNQFRGDYMTANKPLLDKLKSWGFDGALISDWGAWHDDLKAINAGSTIDMPGAWDPKRDAQIAALVQSGKISNEVLDEAVRRNFRFLLRMKADQPVPKAEANTKAHQELARKLAADAMVLLKNDGLLPLDRRKIRSIAVIGPNADRMHTMLSGQPAGGSGAVLPSYEITPLQGLRNKLGKSVRLEYVSGAEFPSGALPTIGASDFVDGIQVETFANQDLKGQPTASTAPEFRFKAGDVPVSARLTGKLRVAQAGRYRMSLSSDDGSRLWLDGKLVIDNWGDHAMETKAAEMTFTKGQNVDVRVEYYNSVATGEVKLGWRREKGDDIAAAVSTAKNCDVAIVFAGVDHTHDTEGSDKPDLNLIGAQSELIRAVARANKKTIVVLINGSPITVEDWYERAPALLEAWYPGQESGNAIADVLFGDADPGGRLPMTFGKRLEDWPVHRLSARGYPGEGENGQEFYDDDLWMGYRGFDHYGTQPRYPFGFGLSYAKFAFSRFGTTHFNADWYFELDVKNVSHRAGTEVIQVYTGPAVPQTGRPVRELRGFAKVRLQPGETKRVRVDLAPQPFETFNSAKKQWETPNIFYRLWVGTSSRNMFFSSQTRVRRAGID